MSKNALTAFWTDSEALKSLIVLLAIIYMTIQGIISAEIGMAAMLGQSGIYGGLRTFKKTSERRSEALKYDALADITENLPARGDEA